MTTVEAGPDVLQTLDAAALRRWCSLGLSALTAARAEIDELNVYPVADSDTGINLQRTMEAVTAAVDVAAGDLAATVQAIARGALMGARGNSGVILSQLLRGLCETFGQAERVDAEAVQRGLIRAAELGYAAVAAPVEGTMLSVAREAAASAAELGPSTLPSVVQAACAAAASALAGTTALLPQLRDAGVVDAGGRGLCVLLDALRDVVLGDAGAATGSGEHTRELAPARRDRGTSGFGYEVQYLLGSAPEPGAAALRRRLSELGDCVLVVGEAGLHNVHVHVDVDDIGAAIEAGLVAGRPFQITVTRFADQ